MIRCLGLALAVVLALAAGAEAQPFMFGGGGLSGVTSTGTVVDITSTSGQWCIGGNPGLDRPAVGSIGVTNCSSTRYVYMGLVNGYGGFVMSSTGQLIWTSGAIGAVSDTGLVRGAAAGLISMTDSTTGGGGLQFRSMAEPTCNSTNRGALTMVQGGAGVADTFRICTKDAADAYAYRALF